MQNASSREVHLKARPEGMPTSEHFAMVETVIPDPEDGQVLVRNLFMSVDPYMRGRMNDIKSYIPPFEIGKPLEGSAIGKVIASRVSGIKSGDIVSSFLGWRETFVTEAKNVRVVDGRVQPLSAYLGALGPTGLTAWLGLNLVNVKAGDRVFISAAAGAVGSIAGQLAKLRGCYVIGSAGNASKVKILTSEFGFDAAFNYKDGNLSEQLSKCAPEGIDVYFDNVGGSHLEAALTAMCDNGRIISCGSVSNYNVTAPPAGPNNLFLITTKRLTMKGFIVSDHLDQMPAFVKEVGGLLATGKLKTKETVVVGIEHAADAFLNLFKGENTGKMVVKLDPPA